MLHLEWKLIHGASPFLQADVKHIWSSHCTAYITMGIVQLITLLIINKMSNVVSWRRAMESGPICIAHSNYRLLCYYYLQLLKECSNFNLANMVFRRKKFACRRCNHRSKVICEWTINFHWSSRDESSPATDLIHFLNTESLLWSLAEWI